MERNMKIYDAASICRSKNAGPYTLTVDLMFDSIQSYERVINSAGLTPGKIAELYGVEASKIKIKPFDRILTIKVTLPRRNGAGGIADSDVYGCQQHFPLASIEI